jgi:alkanesulfonate monooxygenase SsuD/methylene tetrahydromethanopterin reductase-like flavin-dependent oxidoreductase (luciferase family)
MKIGIELAIKTPVKEIEQAIKICEKHNLDRIWIPDSNISLWEFWSVLGVTATISTNLRIGAGVTF